MGDDTRISAMLKEWAATRSIALHAEISNHIFRRRMYYHVLLFVDTIVSCFFFPDTFNILFSTFYPFNSLTPKSPGEPLVSLKMAVTHVTIMVLSKLLGNLKFIFAQRGVFELPFTRNVLMLVRPRPSCGAARRALVIHRVEALVSSVTFRPMTCGALVPCQSRFML